MMICVHRDGFVCCDKCVCDKPFYFIFLKLYNAMRKKMFGIVKSNQIIVLMNFSRVGWSTLASYSMGLPSPFVNTMVG